MSIWIVGSEGMLGSSLVEILKREGISYVATSKTEVNILRKADIAAFLQNNKVTSIINCAAYTSVDRAEIESEECFSINVEGACNLAVFARQSNCTFIQLSTDYLFNAQHNQPLSENARCAPCNIYGKSKYYAEILLQKIYPETCIVRTSWLFSEKKKNFVTSFLEKFENLSQFKIVNDQWGRPTSCQDLSEALIKLIGKSGIYHFANTGETTWFSFAKEIYQIAQDYRQWPSIEITPITSLEYPTKAKRPQSSILSTDRFENECKSIPRHWKEALRECIEKYYTELCPLTPSKS